ncbi:MAG: biotin/lipoate A/B protein ligase family protein [Anaerolineae bacterium]|nr:biotin/lipoate A/B protein ligase family protein [Anaerolineae bacterium]MDQ7034554.1 biotin/lipoate A/B protein ligase family protein [Anaerolineae bacterium]
MRQWDLLVNTPMMGMLNMATDEVLLKSVANKTRLPTLRLYAWNPLCLSLGYGQRIREVDLDRIAEYGWGLVRRPTGGKAILHGNEITYSVALPRDHDLAQGDVVESYRRISEALLAGLHHLGLSPQSEKQAKGNRGLGPVCFEVPSHYEITADGKKLLGSAQLRRKIGILQHGTLPLHGDIALICDALVYPDEASRIAAKTIVRERATTLESVVGYRISWDEAASAIVSGFVETFDIEFTESTLTDDEHHAVDVLVDEQYAHSDWMNKR